MCLVSGVPAWGKYQQDDARERKFASCSRQASRIVDFSIPSVWSKGILAFRRDSRGKSNGRRWQNTAAQRPSSFHHNFREWDKLQHLSPDPRTMPWELQPSLWLNPLGSLRAGVVSGEPSCNWPMRHWLAVLINKSFCAAAEPTFTDTLRTEKGRPSGSPSSRGMDVTMNSPFSSTDSLFLSPSLLRLFARKMEIAITMTRDKSLILTFGAAHLTHTHMHAHSSVTSIESLYDRFLNRGYEFSK